MKLVKSLLLGSAAGLVAVAGASAADLGVKKPTAVEYVRTCPQFGAGFFVVPGTTSCLRVLGRVRVDYLFNNDLARGADKNTFRARGYLQADHRTASEYGLVRTFIRLWMNRDGNGAVGPGFAANTTAVELAFIQFGGLTVGRATSIAEHGYSFNLVGSNAIGGFSDLFAVNQAAYTFAFGGGFSASIALEDNGERRVNFAGFGQALPDVVGSLDYSASWGSVKVAAAAHQLRNILPTVSTKYGYAVLGAARFNLPFGAAGSNIWVNGTYFNGASNYAGYGNGTATIGAVAFTPADAIVVAGVTQTTKGYALSGGLQAFFTPTVYAGITGYYGVMDPFGAANTIRTTSIIGTVGWLPVAGLQFVGEAVYRSIGASAGVLPAGTKSDWTGRIRVQRDF